MYKVNTVKIDGFNIKWYNIKVGKVKKDSRFIESQPKERSNLMITRQHAALTFMSLATIGRTKTFRKYFPWVLLPEAIRAYIGPRQPSHFEELPDQTDISRMVFPSPRDLKRTNRDTAMKVINFHLADAPKCVIGEKTRIEVFDYLNIEHDFYHALRVHLLQDRILDEVLRNEMVDVKERFSDIFTIKHSGKCIDGKELRTQIARFEELGFIKLVGMVYERTGLLLEREWFDRRVYDSLKKAYPADLAENTYRYMSISDELNNRINGLQFDLTEEEKASVEITENLDHVLQNMYESALSATLIELS